MLMRTRIDLSGDRLPGPSRVLPVTALLLVLLLLRRGNKREELAAAAAQRPRRLVLARHRRCGGRD